MFSAIRRVLGAIEVKQTDKDITISGIPADVMLRDISKVWKTSRINTYMFTQTGRNSISFPLFFAPDVMYMLEKMTAHRSRWTNVRTLTKIKDLLLDHTWLRDTQLDPTPRMDLRRINNLIYKPLDYQQRFFESYDRLTQQYQLNGYLLAAAAGGGKTYVSLCLAECLKADLIMVICPKVAIDRVWRKEIITLFRQPQTHWVFADGKPYKGERIVVAHYEALEKVLGMVNQFKAQRPVVVLDESHNLNEVSSMRTQLYLKLVTALQVKDALWASGTAVKALGAEIIPLLRTIDPLFTPDVEQRFRKIYGRDGNRGLDILQHRLGLVSFKVEKHELGLDKPRLQELNVVIPNGKDYTLSSIRRDMQAFIAERITYYKARRTTDQVFYDECLAIHQAQLTTKVQQQEFATYRHYVKLIQRAHGDARIVGAEIRWSNQYEKQAIHLSLPQAKRNAFKDVKSIIKYTNLKIQGEALGRVLGRKRIDCHVDMVPYVDFKGVCNSTPKKTVVFTSFVEALEASKRHLDGQGMSPVVVYGKTNNELANTVKLFEKQEDLNPLIATYHSLSTAVPLVMADTMIMLNAPFRSYIREQAISRIHRLGMDTQAMVYEVRLDTGGEPNISTRSGDILAWSQQQVSAIMGIDSPFDMTEGDGTLTISTEQHDIEEQLDLDAMLQHAYQQRPVSMDW